MKLSKRPAVSYHAYLFFVCLILAGCKSITNDEETLSVGQSNPPPIVKGGQPSGTSTPSEDDYKPSVPFTSKVKNIFNILYQPVTYRSKAFYLDYNAANITPFENQLPNDLDDLIKKGTFSPAAYDALSNAVTSQIQLVLQKQRNDFLFKYMSVISKNYANYVSTVTGGKAAFDWTSDTIIIAGSAVSAATPVAATKTLWSLGVTAFTGSKLSFDRNVFLNQSILLLASKMEQNRQQARDYIKGKMKDSIGDYPLSEAALDLQDLYEAGSLIRVLESLNNSINNTNSKPSGTIPVFSTQPINPISIHLAGGKASAIITAKAIGDVSYQWQFSSNSIQWANCDSTPYNGTTSSTLTIQLTDLSLNGFIYRCVATDNNSKVSAISSISILTVN